MYLGQTETKVQNKNQKNQNVINQFEIVNKHGPRALIFGQSNSFKINKQSSTIIHRDNGSDIYYDFSHHI